MAKQQILYSRIRLLNVPDDTPVKITRDQRKIYYLDNRKKVYLKDLDIIPEKNNFSFMKIKIENENENG